MKTRPACCLATFNFLSAIAASSSSFSQPIKHRTTQQPPPTTPTIGREIVIVIVASCSSSLRGIVLLSEISRGTMSNKNHAKNSLHQGDATTSNNNNNNSASSNNRIINLFVHWYIRLAQQPIWDWIFVTILLLFEGILSLLIIWKIPYTEIDWIAYMEEVDMWWINGEYDYRNIYGNTGPLVYPAGFLYLFVIIQKLTNRNIRTAQYIFWIFYMLTQGIILVLYTIVLQYWRQQQQQQKKQQQQPLVQQSHHMIWSFRIAMGCLCLSKRYHSIFLLRLFNDGPTMLVTYLSFYFFIYNQWNIGCLFFSIAVSIKMNVLLFAPGLLYLLIENSMVVTSSSTSSSTTTQPWYVLVLVRLGICGISQLLFGAPFLLRYPISYLRKAFELDRQFFYKWTVNFKFLSEEWFLSSRWSILLLVTHITLLGWYFGRLGIMMMRQRHHHRRLRNTTTTTTTSIPPQYNKSIHKDTSFSSSFRPDHVLLTLFVSNFIGICCARTLHYQFYSWYFSSLPLLLWQQQCTAGGSEEEEEDGNDEEEESSSSSQPYSIYPFLLRLLLLACIEYAFLTFPATAFSSIILQIAHWSILLPHLIFVGRRKKKSDGRSSLSSSSSPTTTTSSMKLE